ncbi:hypothetical protein [Emticicia sp. CRIBPO]|uniref:hypothetical protein n=1 Tax=Emticicia sp. CRIBPO TaxID=2683258 RepID=UPI001E4E60F5|nr:hypothetical protein [Emticicia sp. CRIBPO]
MFRILIVLLLCSMTGFTQEKKKPVVVITDCYHPYQDPGDNLDLMQGFALPDVNLLGVILDITDAFRKDTADHPTLWKDPRGPREAGIIPVEQLNYIFNRKVPYAVGPMSLMKSETDKMTDAPEYGQEGIRLFLSLLEKSKEPVEVLSFGSARVLAVAFNRNPELLKRKVSRIFLSGGTASKNHELGADKGANMIPGGEWNVALDVYAFTRILRSGLPVALYPCAGKDGGFVKDVNSSYYKLHDMSFLRDMDPKLQRYLAYAFDKKLQHDFLKAMEVGNTYAEGKKLSFEEFHVWESAIWLNATGREIVKQPQGGYILKRKKQLTASDLIVESRLRPCKLTEIRDDGRFQFEYSQNSNISIYFRPDVEENERALNAVIPELYKSFKP